MIVPQYWAETSIRKQVNGKTVTIKRYGWSDESEPAALRHAQERATDALRQIEAGQAVSYRERKVPYNGAEGMPIREEVIKRLKDSVITRNSYGALCINTPDVLFADIDVDNHPGFFSYFLAFMTLLALSGAFAWELQSWGVFVAAAMASLGLCFILGRIGYALFSRLFGSAWGKAMAHIKAFADAHPDWHLRVYRTPAGYRILVMHSTFEPADERVGRFFTEVKTDPLYIRMCQNQRCFRARISPKPWRIGLKTHIRPSNGAWPVSPELLPDRRQWIDDYEQKAQGFAACRFEIRLGSEKVHPRAEFIRAIHDDYSRAASELQLA